MNNGVEKMLDTLNDIGVTTADKPMGNSGLYGGYQTWAMVVEQTAASTTSLVLRGAFAPWVMEAAKKLEAIGKLKPDWDSYGGAALDLAAKKLTVNALGWLANRDLPVPAVVLGSSGTVQLEWRGDGKELEIELGKGGIEFLKVDPDNESEEGSDNTEIPQRLRELTWWFLNA